MTSDAVREPSHVCETGARGRSARRPRSLRFYEHVSSGRPAFARWQRRVDSLWSRLMGGCHPDRDTLAAILDAGFQLERYRSFWFPPSARIDPVAPRILGTARAN